MTPKTKLNIQRLKKFAFTKLPKDSALREILLAEAKEIDVSTFLVRVPIWLQLSALKRGNEK